MEVDDPIPDHYRCSRTDGKGWRCFRRAMKNFSFCELHHLQALRRQKRLKVPDFMKIQRKLRRNSDDGTGMNSSISFLGDESISSSRKMALMLKMGCSRLKCDALEKSLMRLKKGNSQLDLVRMVLRRKMQRKNYRKLDEKNKVDLMMELPNGIMAISPVPVRDFNDAPMIVDRKLWLDSRVFLRRWFRSKNAEPIPIGSNKILPCCEDVISLGRNRKRKCHRCQKSNTRRIVQCLSCKKEFFCSDCIENWYSKMTEEEIIISCPVCRADCQCNACLNRGTYDGRYDTSFLNFVTDSDKVNRAMRAHYLICLLLPILKQINEEQSIELEIEAKIQGRPSSDLRIHQVECYHDEELCCDNCKTSIVNFHRSCINCSYDLCLSCCREIREGIPPGGIGLPMFSYPNRGKFYVHGGKSLLCRRKVGPSHPRPGISLLTSMKAFPEWKINDYDGTIPCPPKELGGCGDSALDLKCILPLNWTHDLETYAEGIICSYGFPETIDISSQCSCFNVNYNVGEFSGRLVKAAFRENSEDNYLYCPSASDIKNEGLEHFQKHWIKGEPIIVRNVFTGLSNLNWDPMTMFHSVLGQTNTKMVNCMRSIKATDCLDWCEVEISIEQFIKGYLEGRAHRNLWPEMLKVKGWPAPNLFKDQLPAYYYEFMHSLPFQEYTDPSSGVLNLGVKLGQDNLKSLFGPWLYMSFGNSDELGRGDSVTKLHFELSDVVNVLTHTHEVTHFPKQIAKIERLKKRHKAQNKMETYERGSTEWGNVHTIKQEILNSQTSEISQKRNICSELCNVPAEKTCFSIMLLKREKCKACDDEENMVDSSKNITDAMNPKHCQVIDMIQGRSLIDETSGSVWDIFRKEDITKLEAYLREHKNEFRHTYCSPIEHVAHPIHDQSFFLDAAHKRKLKEEFQIEPWTFIQHTGEAVIVPAGCPYQVRYLKSCMQMELDFISPENVSDSIRLMEELRLLPRNHKAKEDKIEARKVCLFSISDAVKEIQEFTSVSMNTPNGHKSDA